MEGLFVEMYGRGARAIADAHGDMLYKPGPKQTFESGPLAGITEVKVNAEGTVIVRIEGRAACKRYAAQLFIKDVDFAATSVGKGGKYVFNSTFTGSVKMLIETCRHLNYHLSKAELSRVKTQ